MDRVIFCVFLPKDLQLYGELLHTYFPLKPSAYQEREEGVEEEKEEGEEEEKEEGEEEEEEEEEDKNDSQPLIPPLQKSVSEPGLNYIT